MSSAWPRWWSPCSIWSAPRGSTPGSWCGAAIARPPSFHQDWIDTHHQAFTLITPVQLGDPPAALLHKKTDGSEGRYPYRIGKGIIFGDEFIHSTEPGTCDPAVVLLSFTFGTDRMTHWERIARSGAYQGNLLRRPDGSFLCHGIDD